MLARVLIPLLFFAAPPQFQLRDTQGAAHTQAEWAAQKAVVLFFVTIDCPVGNSYVPEMNRIRETYANRGVAVYAVQADPSVPDADVAKYARDYRYTFPLLLDPDQILVRHTNATVTPQAAILSPQGRVLYLGPIDNRMVDFGKSRPQATESYVRLLLDATLNGRGITMSPPRSIGCSHSEEDPMNLLLALLLLAADPQEVKLLPDAPAKEAVVKVCLECHGVANFRKVRKDPDEWTDSVQDMVDRGAKATQPEIDAIVAYMVKNFGKGAKVQMNSAPLEEIKAVLGFTVPEAKALVDYREQNGAYKDWRDVLKAPGVDPARIESKKDAMSF